MNEHIDLIFAGAKMTARNNEVASTAIHGVSAFYYVGQMARYRALYYQEQYAYIKGDQGASAYRMGQYRCEMWKYTVLGSIDMLSLLFNAISEMRDRC